MRHRSRKSHAGARALVSLRLVHINDSTYQVIATNRGRRYPYSNNPIGFAVANEDGTWGYHGVSGTHVTLGHYKTPARAAQEMYRAHRSWVGY